MRKIWIQLRSSLWFVPAIQVIFAIVAALGLIELDLRLGDSLGWGKLRPFFGSGAEGARGMLSAIASSMITVAGVAFSVTIVTLSLASTQYTPRLVRNFMRDRANQFVLGTFVGIYVYCLIVLRTIRSEDDDIAGFVPLVSVFFGIILALLSIGCLIYFIHHVATSIQASSILEMITKETLNSIDSLYPRKMDGEEQEGDNPQPRDAQTGVHKIRSTRTGYIQNIHNQGLLCLARDHDLTLRVELGPGSFVVEGAPLIGVSMEVGEEIEDKLRHCFVIGDFRTVDQDPGFGVRQIVDIAMKALSPGINDTSTAVSCLNYLSTILCRVAGRYLGAEAPDGNDQGRLVTQHATFAHFLGKSLDEIRHSAEGNVTIIRHMLRMLTRVAHATRAESRKATILYHAEIIFDLADRTVGTPHDRVRINEELARTRNALSLPVHRLPALPLRHYDRSGG